MSKVHAFHSMPKKILLPIDFSLSSQAALEIAADLAKHFHAELHLVHVIPMFPTSTLPDFVPETKFLLPLQDHDDFVGRSDAVVQNLAVSRAEGEIDDGGTLRVADFYIAGFVFIHGRGRSWHQADDQTGRGEMIRQSAQGTVGRNKDTIMRVPRLKRDPVRGARGHFQGRGWTVAVQVTLLSFRISSATGTPTSACLRTDTICSTENFFFIGKISSPFLRLALPKY